MKPSDPIQHLSNLCRRLKTPDDVTTAVRAIARDNKFEDRDLVK